ncbi:MAG: alanine--tRNA ligase, partial [Anaerolineae bacterium]|nr:alanine--tRNA ligase [Anaerolineae bacterium]
AERDANIVPYRVIADHLRAAVFLIADGVLPGAKGRDSVCRLVIRRAARFGSKLGFQEPFLGQVADSVIDIMGGHYTELVERAAAIKKVITQEEVRFRRTLDRGLSELESMLADLEQQGTHELPGAQAFYLKATLGLPLEVIRDIAEEHDFSVDLAGFQAQEALHSEVSGGGQAMGVIASAETYSAVLNDLKSSGQLSDSGVRYEPYGPSQVETQVLALVRDGQRIESAIVGDKVEVIVERTSFYVEAGGQVSDTGLLAGAGWVIEVEDMQRPVGGLIVHVGEVVEGTPREGNSVRAEVDVRRRADITRNHTATHLLHAALRHHLGTHVQQRGSLVAPDRLRFDFAHDGKVTPEEMRLIAAEVNDVILANYPVRSEEKSLAQARQEGAMALFGEKYGDRVRTIIIENGARYSYELCGGVHVKETAEIGQMVIVSEGSVSAGIRRVEALTGHAAQQYVQDHLHTLNEIAQHLGTTPEHTAERIDTLQEELAASKKELASLRREVARTNFNRLMDGMERINGVSALIARVDDVTMDNLREMSDWFRNKVDSGVLVLGTVVDDRPQLLVAVTDDLTKKGLHAGNLVKGMAAKVGGGGGGRPNLAQAGGKDADQLPAALEHARQMIGQ